MVDFSRSIINLSPYVRTGKGQILRFLLVVLRKLEREVRTVAFSFLSLTFVDVHFDRVYLFVIKKSVEFSLRSF